MTRTGGARRRASKAPTLLVCALLLASATACSTPEPDEQKVTEVVGRLPGVTSVNASFENWNLGNGGDQSLEVELAEGPDAKRVEDLVRNLPRAAQEVAHGDRYDEFVIRTSSADDAPAEPTSSLSWGRDLPEPGLATRWVAALASLPEGSLDVRVRSAPSRVSASLRGPSQVSQSLQWAAGTELTEAEWTLSRYQTTGTPYVRFIPGRPLTHAMAGDWTTIEATWANGIGAASVARVVVVEDVAGIRRVRLSVSFPAEAGPLAEATHGNVVWPIVTAIHDAMPSGHRLDLELTREVRGGQDAGAGDGDLVDGGTGSPDWESAYRQRFPDAMTPTATPT